MLLPQGQEMRDVSGISDEQKKAIKAFMQGAVYCWAKNQKDVEFAVRDLVGGDNADWGGTPLQALYDKHVQLGKDHPAAFDAAAIDLGWLVKAVLEADARKFTVSKSGRANAYLWVG